MHSEILIGDGFDFPKRNTTNYKQSNCTGAIVMKIKSINMAREKKVLNRPILAIPNDDPEKIINIHTNTSRYCKPFFKSGSVHSPLVKLSSCKSVRY